jgi:hypothetical protein
LVCKANASGSSRHCAEAFNVIELPSGTGAAKVSFVVSPKRKTKPGPKGPDADIIRAVIEMKQRNPTWGCPRIAEQINLAFGTCINKDVVRRILAKHYPQVPNNGGIVVNVSWPREGQLVDPETKCSRWTAVLSFR